MLVDTEPFSNTFRKCSACVSSTTRLRMESNALSLMAVCQRCCVSPVLSFGISFMTCCHVRLAAVGSPAFQYTRARCKLKPRRVQCQRASQLPFGVCDINRGQ